jgi:hypothetical protein
LTPATFCSWSLERSDLQLLFHPSLQKFQVDKLAGFLRFFGLAELVGPAHESFLRGDPFAHDSVVERRREDVWALESYLPQGLGDNQLPRLHGDDATLVVYAAVSKQAKSAPAANSRPTH